MKDKKQDWQVYDSYNGRMFLVQDVTEDELCKQLIIDAYGSIEDARKVFKMSNWASWEQALKNVEDHVDLLNLMKEAFEAQRTKFAGFDMAHSLQWDGAFIYSREQWIRG